jgi:hypothetical protein
MRGQIIKDWNKFDYNNPEHKKRLGQALSFFCSLPNKFVPAEFENSEKFKKLHGKVQEAYQAFTTTGDFPASAKPLIDKFHALFNYDNGYEEIYDVRDFTGVKGKGFAMADVESGLTFDKIPIGGKLELKQMSGSQNFVFFDYYGGGLNWHKSLFEDQDYWTLENNAQEFVNKAYYKRASVFYALLEAAMDEVGCDAIEDPNCEDCTEYPIAIANALNDAAIEILKAIKKKGYGANTGIVFKLLVPIQLMGVVKHALNIRLQHIGDAAKYVNFNFSPVYTMMLSDATRIGVFLPKLKIKAGYRTNLTTFSSFDMLSYSEASAGWMAFGGAVGDLDQVKCIDATKLSGMKG